MASHSRLAEACNSTSPSRPGGGATVQEAVGSPGCEREAALSYKRYGLPTVGCLRGAEPRHSPGPDLDYEIFATPDTRPGGEGRRAGKAKRAAHSPPPPTLPGHTTLQVGSPLQPRCGLEDGRRGQANRRGNREPSIFCPHLSPPVLRPVPGAQESRWDWQGRQTWAGIFSS